MKGKGDYVSNMKMNENVTVVSDFNKHMSQLCENYREEK